MNAESTRVARIQLPDGTPVWARISGAEELSAPPTGLSYTDTGFAERVEASVESLQSLITGVARSLSGPLRAVRPDEVSVEFGIELTAKAGKVVGLLADGEAKAAITVTLTWNGGPPDAGTDSSRPTTSQGLPAQSAQSPQFAPPAGWSQAGQPSQPAPPAGRSQAAQPGQPAPPAGRSQAGQPPQLAPPAGRSQVGQPAQPNQSTQFAQFAQLTQSTQSVQLTRPAGSAGNAPAPPSPPPAAPRAPRTGASTGVRGHGGVGGGGVGGAA